MSTIISASSNLPSLPKKRVKIESSVTPRVLAWMRHNHAGSCAIEIKATNKASIPASALEPHQRRALLDATGTGIVHKIADSKRRNPFDAFMLQGVPAYVVACFTSKGLCLAIPVAEWQGARLETPCAFQIKL